MKNVFYNQENQYHNFQNVIQEYYLMKKKEKVVAFLKQKVQVKLMEFLLMEK